jgi:hypothetical protein
MKGDSTYQCSIISRTLWISAKVLISGASLNAESAGIVVSSARTIFEMIRDVD